MQVRLGGREEMGRSIDGETINRAISQKIKDCFWEIEENDRIYPVIYKEYMPESVQKPCFFVRTVKVIQNKVGRNRYERSFYMEVQYHSSLEDFSVDDEERYKGLCSIGHFLMERLKEVEVYALLRGKDMAYRIEKGILHFYITYPLRGYFEESSFVKQKELELREHIKEEGNNGRWNLDRTK